MTAMERSSIVPEMVSCVACDSAGAASANPPDMVICPFTLRFMLHQTAAAVLVVLAMT